MSNFRKYKYKNHTYIRLFKKMATPPHVAIDKHFCYCGFLRNLACADK